MTNRYDHSVIIIMKTDINFNCILRLPSSYSEGNSLGLHYRNEQVNSVQGIKFHPSMRIIQYTTQLCILLKE
jgi:hypothetical protein